MLLGPFGGSWKESWLVLIRKLAFLLLKSVSLDSGYVIELLLSNLQFDFNG